MCIWASGSFVQALEGGWDGAQWREVGQTQKEGRMGSVGRGGLWGAGYGAGALAVCHPQRGCSCGLQRGTPAYHVALFALQTP